ncbi:29531_t:CDS:1, partial [Gigaspora margarita]
MAKKIASFFIFLFFVTTLLNVTLATPVDTSSKHYECGDQCYWGPQHEGYAPCYPNCGCYNSVCMCYSDVCKCESRSGDDGYDGYESGY